MSNKISPNVKSAQKQVIITTIYHKKICIRLQKENYFTHKSEKKDIFESNT